MIRLQKISPFLWFDGEAEAAAHHYVKAFPGSSIDRVVAYGEEGPGPEGSTMIVSFTLAGQSFVALNGGPEFKPNESVSLMVTCEDQAEIDRLWVHLSEGGSTNVCGWLKDRWGFSWQVAPRRMFEIMEKGSAAQRSAAMRAMMKMTKFDIAALEKACADA